jgi:hypothetical protein
MLGVVSRYRKWKHKRHTIHIKTAEEIAQSPRKGSVISTQTRSQSILFSMGEYVSKEVIITLLMIVQRYCLNAFLL